MCQISKVNEGFSQRGSKDAQIAWVAKKV